MTLSLPCCFECSFLEATAQINKPVVQNNCNSKSDDAHVTWPGNSCANREFLETVNGESTACGASYNYPDDEDLVQIKECTRMCEAISPLLLFSVENSTFKY